MTQFQPIKYGLDSPRIISTPFRKCLFWITPILLGSVWSIVQQQSILTSQWKEMMPSTVDLATFDLFQHPNFVYSSGYPTIDIISIGSQRFPQLQNAQNNTFGRHKAIRHFLGVTEETDSEKNCHTNLTETHIRQILQFCKNRNRRWPVSLQKIRVDYANPQWIFRKKEPAGWMCAQKRPMDAIKQYINKFHLNHTDTSNLPDFLIIMDDDTWVSMDNVVPYALQMYPVDRPRVVAGCLVRKRVREMNFTFGFGGYSHLLNKPAIRNLVRPIHCSDEMNLASVNPLEEKDFEKLVCWRLTQSLVGEKHLFRNGMSVADLMFAYTFHNAYLNAASWDARGVGFCMHSDWALGYFLNFYFISNKSRSPKSFRDVPEDRMEGYKHSQFYAGNARPESVRDRGECMKSIDYQKRRAIAGHANGDPFCNSSASFCHRISHNHMQSLHEQALQYHRKDYRQWG